MSLGSLVGFLTIFGIAARNGILMVSHFQHLEREEGVPFGPELVLRGAKERLAPIMMTALATGLALVPLAVAGSIPGHEIEHPMAIVILGGLRHRDGDEPVRPAFAVPEIRKERKKERQCACCPRLRRLRLSQSDSAIGAALVLENLERERGAQLFHRHSGGVAM